jgi:hypothetical protein
LVSAVLYRQIGIDRAKRTAAMKARARSRLLGEVGIAIPFDTMRRTAKNETTEIPKITAITELAFVGFISATRLET